MEGAFYNKDFFKGKSSEKGWQKGKGKGKFKVHVEQLKLRTRCWRCGALGHISRECTNPPSDKGKAGGPAGPPSSSSASTRTGFFVAQEGSTDQDFFTSTGQKESAFWLRQFVESRKASTELGAEISAESEYKERQPPSVSFCGITTGSEFGVVDTAAEGGLVGFPALQRLERRLQDFGLCIKWIPKQSIAKGVGGRAEVVGVALIPMGIGGCNGLLEVTVVAGEVPLLLPVKLMKQLKAVIDFNQNKFVLTDEGIELPMQELASGHVVIDICHVHQDGFKVPEQAPFCENDFRLQATIQAMLAQFDRAKPAASQVLERPSLLPSPSRDVAADGAHGPAAGRLSENPSARRGHEGTGTTSQVGFQELEGAAGQAVHHHGVRRKASFGQRVAAVACTFGAIYATVQAGRRQFGSRVREDHHHGQTFGTTQVEGEAFRVSQYLHPSKAPIEGRRKQDGLLCDLQDVSLQVGIPSAGRRDQGGFEEAEAGPLESNEDESRFEEGRREGKGDRVSESGNHAALARRESPGRFREDGGDEGVRKAKSGHEGEGSADAGDDVHGGEPEGGDGEDARGEESKQPRTSQGTKEDGRTVRLRTSVPLSVDCSQTEETPGGRKQGEGEALLGVQDRPMRVLSVGRHQAEDQSFRDELCCSEQPEEEQKSKDSIKEECGGSGIHSNSGQRLKEEWAEAHTEKGRQVLRKMQTSRHPHLIADRRFQVEVEEGRWEEREGLVPLLEQKRTRVQTELKPRTWIEDFFGIDKETQFNHKQRKEVMKNILKVCEVFSPPRIALQAPKVGLSQGSSFDLETGWDLSKAEERKKMWRKLKEEDPWLIILCPPCTAFSALQFLNFPKMKMENAAMLIKTGMEHLSLAMAIAKWQHQRGRYFLFEHPAQAVSWKEEVAKKVEELEGVEIITTDMCMFGLNVNGMGLNKKPTKLMINSKEMRKRLERRCNKKHVHVPTLCGLPKKAQKYPQEFCIEVLRGLRKQIRVDEEEEGSQEAFMQEEEEDEEEEGGDLEEALERQMEEEMKKENRGEKEQRYQVTEEEKRSVLKLHKGLGHPQRAEFVRFMRAARIRGEIIRWAYQEFVCPACQARAKPKATRPAAIPRTYQPGRVLGIDLIFLPEVGGERLFPALSMVDWGSNYQMVERVADKQPSTIWSTLWSTWGRTFGLPEVLVADAGKEFSSQFMQMAVSHGIVTQTTAARAPWQNGRTERHGAHYKELLEKAREEAVITSSQELQLLMQEVEMTKNRFSNRSGFSPVQRQIGQWPRVPSNLLGDDVIDPGLMNGAVVDDMERMHEMRRIAQKAFIEHNAKEALKRVEQGRTRVPQEFTAGDYVYVYRVPRAKKRKHEGSLPSHERTPNKATWVGPGTLIAVDGASLWISMFGELWRVAREQCRRAINIEQQGIEEAMRSCKELIEDFKRSSNRKGYKDLRGEAWPEEDEGEDAEGTFRKRPREEGAAEEEEEANRRRPRREEEEGRGMEEYSPTQVGEDERGVQAGRAEGTSSIKEEPEEEEEVRSSDKEAEGRKAREARAEEVSEAFRRSMVESVQRARTLDGLPPTGGPVRWRQLKERDVPRSG